MKEKNGFTLIELLAVIVILAIIALIATPIVLNIISDSKESAQLRGAEFYLDAVEYSIANSVLDNNPMIDGIYDVLETGNLCLEYDENKTCLNERTIELDGEKPKGGYVIIEKGQIIESRMAYEGNDVLYVEGKNSFISNYEIGDEVVYNAGDQDRTWNVISETEDTVTLMLNENINVRWISESDYNTYNKDNTTSVVKATARVDEGPITAFKYMNSIGSSTNADTITDFTYVNDSSDRYNNYKKIEIKDGITTIIDSENVGETLTGTTKLRLITIEELIKIAQIQNPYYRNVNFEYLIGFYLKQDGNTTPVKDYINERVKNVKDFGFLDDNLYITLCTAQILIIECNSELAYLPSWLGANMINDGDGVGYYTLTSKDLDGLPNVYSVLLTENNDALIYLDKPDDTTTGIRPIIKISKDKLK